MTQNTASDSNKKKRIVIIDDNTDLLETLVEFLELKFEVKSFTGAQAALDFFGTDHNIDLIVCDYTMPMMSGAEFLKRLRKNGLLMPIIFLTGNVSLDLAREALRLGAMDILDKPLNPLALRDIIDRGLILEQAREDYYSEKAAGRATKKNKMLGIMIAGNSEKNKKIKDGE